MPYNMSNRFIMQIHGKIYYTDLFPPVFEFLLVGGVGIDRVRFMP